MVGRSYRWLRARIFALLSTPPIGWRDITEGKRTRPVPLWGTRIQSEIYPTR